MVEPVETRMVETRMTVREATPDDVAAVAALEADLFGLDAWNERQVVEELIGPGRRAWVVGEPAVGYAVTWRAGDVVDLQRVGVRPGHRRRGLARKLLDVAVATAEADGAQAMLLEVAAGNDAALAFYAATGFEEIDRRRRYYRDGSDAVVMRLALDVAARQERMSQ